MNLTTQLLSVALAVTLTTPTFAAGSDTTTPPTETKTAIECKKGQVWDETKEECVKIKESNLNDGAIYRNARELAYSARYLDALDLLARAKNPNDPRILNYKGFTNRKLGRVQTAMSYYNKALTVDPNYILARSYYGQAKMQQGDIVGAQEQLVMILDIAGTGTWAYQSLDRAIKGDTTADY